MTLIGAILKKAKSQESITRKYTSPPPEIEGELQKIKRKYVFDKYSHIRSVVDASPPEYLPGLMTRTIPKYHRHLEQIYYQNIQLLMAIKKAHFMRGRVDCWWKKPPPDYSQQYYKNRMNSFKRIQIENQIIYKRIVSTEPRVASTASLQDDWRYNRRQILLRAQAPFILFQPVPKEIIEDAAFESPMGIKRPRVYLTLRIKNCGILGELTAELFTDVCPLTCDLFLTLLDGDEAGHAYVGTKFFRKVPSLYWSGGDVIYNNGYGCYVKRGATVPIGAENYHFSHSVPGLLTMRVTDDDEVCGIFSITFKPLPQFDLKNVVFGRIIRPCKVYESIRELGSPLSVQPVIELASARRRVSGCSAYGLPNIQKR